MTHSTEDSNYVVEFREVEVLDAQHGIFMDIMAKRYRETVCSCPYHLQCQVGIVAVNSDEETHFDVVVPDSQIGMIRIDHLLRIHSGVFGAIIGHRDDHDTRDLRS